MKILLTGGAGYLGSVLVPKLLVRGHQVRVVDVGYFGLGHLRSLNPPVELIREDIRRVRESEALAYSLLDGCDAVIHLAAVSNDPSSELNPELTVDVNLRATESLALAARQRGVRFLFSSSCSVYGEAEGEVDEDGRLQPLSIYAQSKIDAERRLEELSTPAWRPVILRNGTLFGFSPRMRFDLVVNIFALYAVLYGRIKVFGGGGQWRPFLHVADCARAFVFFAEHTAPAALRYNVAHENLRVTDLAATFRELRPGLVVENVDLPEADPRNYRVSVRRLTAEGFRTSLGVRAGAEAVMEAIVTGQIPDPESTFYRNAKWLRELREASGKELTEFPGLGESFSGAPGRKP